MTLIKGHQSIALLVPQNASQRRTTLPKVNISSLKQFYVESQLRMPWLEIRTTENDISESPHPRLYD